MRLGVIVSEFPKVTETFVLRDLIEFHRHGHEVRIYHLTAFRRNEVVHDFARPTLSWTRPRPYLFGRAVIGALVRALGRHPGTLAAIVRDLIRGYRRRPVLLAKSLFILPKCLSFAEDLAAWKVDHVHAEFAGHPATCAWIVGRMTGLPYSVSCHAHDIFVTQAMLDVKLGEAAFVRAISDFNRRFLLARVPGLDGGRIEVIHCGADLAKIPPLEPPPAEGEFRILYVGSLQIRKGVHVLLRALAAARALGDWSCGIIGGGPEEKKLERLAADLGLRDRVRFHGPLPFEQVSRALAQAHVLVVPSIVLANGRTEGIPTVIMEALAHQRPVIATRVSGVPELVEDGETGYLVPPADERALAGALERLREDPETGHRLAQQGRRRVLAEFDAAKNAAAQLSRFARFSATASRGAAS